MHVERATTRSTSRMYALSAVELPVRGKCGRQVLSARPGKQDKKAAARVIWARGTGKTQPNSSKKVQMHLPKCALAHSSFLRLEPHLKY